jgi:hypothetical protein
MEVPLEVTPLLSLTPYYWRIRRRLFGGKVERAERDEGGPAGVSGEPRSRSSNRISRIERRLLAFDAIRALRRAARLEPVLSNDAILAERQERFQAVVNDVIREFTDAAVV